METVVLKRVVIIGDCDLEARLLKDILALGATGYTCYSVRGRGGRGVRPRYEKTGNLKIEVIASREVAQKILEHVAENYFEDYAMIGFIDDVEVLKGQHFVGRPPIRTLKPNPTSKR
jgi:nitrogen regulatory protein P-II 2